MGNTGMGMGMGGGFNMGMNQQGNQQQNNTLMKNQEEQIHKSQIQYVMSKIW